MTLNYFLFKRPGNHEELVAYAEKNRHEVKIEYEQDINFYLGNRMSIRKYVPVAKAGEHRVFIHEHVIRETLVYIGKADVESETRTFEKNNSERFERMLEDF